LPRSQSILSASLCVGVAVIFLSGLCPVSAEATDEDAAPATEFGYVGARKCKMCHKKEETGQQFQRWEESKHSKAFETLGSDKAAEYAAARDIKGSPQEAPECLRCHSTAFGMDPEALAASKITLAEGVSCESCHGPGSAYAKKKLMQRITDGEDDGAAYGLVIPSEEVCVGCHNEESPAFTGFDFDEFFEKIAHPRPSAE